jgi:hypothetical protein
MGLAFLQIKPLEKNEIDSGEIVIVGSRKEVY